MELWSIEVFTDPHGFSPFESWLKSDLTPAEIAAVDLSIQKVLIPNGINLASTKWLTALGQGLFEFRISHSAEEIAGFYAQKGVGDGRAHPKILLRIFLHFYGEKVVLILGGYNKGQRDQKRHQQLQITEARKLLKQWKEERG